MKKLFQFGGLALALLVCCTSLGATPPVHARDVGYVRSAAVFQLGAVDRTRFAIGVQRGTSARDGTRETRGIRPVEPADGWRVRGPGLAGPSLGLTEVGRGPFAECKCDKCVP